MVVACASQHAPKPGDRFRGWGERPGVGCAALAMDDVRQPEPDALRLLVSQGERAVSKR
jgi:hypothetical protein